jgi:hypothetical protein
MAQVRNQSERTTFHRFAHRVNRGRRNGSRNPTVSKRELVQEAAEGGPGGGDALAEAVAAG